MYCIEENTCDIVGTFRRRPPKSFGARELCPRYVPDRVDVVDSASAPLLTLLLLFCTFLPIETSLVKLTSQELAKTPRLAARD